MGLPSRFVLLLVFLLLAGITSLLSVEAYRAYASKHWPTTGGVVIGFYETPRYRYSVNGAWHTNDVASCNEFFSRSVAIKNSERYAARYPLEAKVAVHYHPQKPDLAALETQFDPSILGVIAALALADLFCAAILSIGWATRLVLGPR